MNYILKVKDAEIPLSIQNYKKSKSIKLYFREGVLKVTKSPYISKKQVDRLIKNNEEKIYEEYKKILEKNNLSKLQIVYGKSDTTCDKNMLKYEKKYIRRAKISSMVDCSEVKDDIKTIFEKAKDFFTGITNKALKLLGGEKKLELSEGEKQEEHSMTDDERIQKMKEKMNVYSKEEYSKKVSETQEILSKEPNARDVASKTAQSIASRMRDDEGR